MSDLAVGILGGAGRMGRALVRAVTEAMGATVIGAVDAPGNPEMGKDLGTLAGIDPLGVTLGGDVRALFQKADVIIDFTIPRVTAENARIAVRGSGFLNDGEHNRIATVPTSGSAATPPAK